MWFLLGVIFFLGIRFLVAHAKEIGRFLGICGWVILGVGIMFILILNNQIWPAIGVGILAYAFYPFRKEK